MVSSGHLVLQIFSNLIFVSGCSSQLFANCLLIWIILMQIIVYFFKFYVVANCMIVDHFFATCRPLSPLYEHRCSRFLFANCPYVLLLLRLSLEFLWSSSSRSQGSRGRLSQIFGILLSLPLQTLPKADRKY